MQLFSVHVVHGKLFPSLLPSRTSPPTPLHEGLMIVVQAQDFEILPVPGVPVTSSEHELLVGALTSTTLLGSMASNEAPRVARPN